MQSVSLASLRENISFTKDLMLDNNFVLLPPSCPVTNELISTLREWNFHIYHCEGTINYEGDVISDNTSSKDEVTEEIVDKNKNSKIGQSVKQVLKNSLNSQIDGSDKSRMVMVEKVYYEYMNYIEQIYTHYATHKEIDQEELSETIRDLCGFIKDNRRYILRINNNIDCPDKNFLVIHTIRSTVLALAISMQMHMPISKMVELGVACVIHEIGMLRLPPQIYMTEKKLTPGEKIQIYKHPLLGYQIIRDLNFPPNIQLGVLEHHEKENGSGYPRRITGDKISSIAKIISVACSYEAISSPRSYKDGRTNFDAILELLQNTNHPYDENVIKALLYTVSLYPIGSYVYLTNRKVAVVTDTNPDNPKQPVVQMLTEKDKDGSPLIIQTATSDIKILRIMNKREQEDIIKLINEQEKKNEENNVTKEEKTTKNESSFVTSDIIELENQDEFIDEIFEAPEVLDDNSDENIDGNQDEDLNENQNQEEIEQKQEEKSDSNTNKNSNSSDSDMENIDISIFS